MAADRDQPSDGVPEVDGVINANLMDYRQLVAERAKEIAAFSALSLPPLAFSPRRSGYQSTRSGLRLISRIQTRRLTRARKPLGQGGLQPMPSRSVDRQSSPHPGDQAPRSRPPAVHAETAHVAATHQSVRHDPSQQSLCNVTSEIKNMGTPPKIGQLISMPDGLAVARVSIQHIVVVPSGNGCKFINIQDGDRHLRFDLDQSQCAHLAALLLADSSPSNVQELRT